MGEGGSGVEGREACERPSLIGVNEAQGSGQEGKNGGDNPFQDFGYSFEEDNDPEGGRAVVRGFT